MNGSHRIPRASAALRRVGALILTTLAATACSELAAESPLFEARRSPEALAEAALRALEAGDADGLRALRVTKEEYETLLWPVLPDRTQMPFAFAWSMTDPRARKAARNVLEDYRDVPLELIRVELGDERETYEGLVIHQDARMHVRRTDTGQEGVLPLMDTVVEMGGGWKFLNFRDHL